MAQALRRTPATMVFIGNLGRELSPAAASLSVADKLQMMERLSLLLPVMLLKRDFRKDLLP